MDHVGMTSAEGNTEHDALRARTITTFAGKNTRTRTGCWNCRRRRKKCDERRPVCRGCAQKHEPCEWGVKLSFRDENVQTIPENHPSMCQDVTEKRDCCIEIVDITREIIRDYWSEFHAGEGRDHSPSTHRTINSYSSHSGGGSHTGHQDTEGRASREMSSRASLNSALCCPGDSESPASINTPQSFDTAHSAAVQLLGLGAVAGAAPPFTTPQPSPSGLGACYLPPSQQLISEIPEAGALSPEQLFNVDGIFMPGSAYLELHSVLRHHIFDTARSTFTSRLPTPIPRSEEADDRPIVTDQRTGQPPACAATDLHHHNQEEDENNVSLGSTPRSIELTGLEEYVLWKNWVEEIAPWLDKFDRNIHFQQKLPALAKEHSHLRFAMLALSARQLERKHPERPSSGSLALYQEAVHQLIPQLQTKSTEVVASCVVLCVLEMMDCSPRMWRRHLDGCACLIQALGMHGFSGGLEQALFWCFARMDVCGGLISSESTLIPAASWTSTASLAEAVELFCPAAGCDMYANLAVFLCAQVLDLFSSDAPDPDFTRRWNHLFAHIEAWYVRRPPEMLPILSQPPPTACEEEGAGVAPFPSPFPTILFSNPPAISGNQLYHTAALLMLQKKPRRAALPPNTRSVLWHARRICAISICNTHHGCWTNCVQPLWIAGQVMSHPAEHRAILEAYARIERELGWGANWRAEDLKSHWRELDQEC